MQKGKTMQNKDKEKMDDYLKEKKKGDERVAGQDDDAFRCLNLIQKDK